MANETLASILISFFSLSSSNLLVLSLFFFSSSSNNLLLFHVFFCFKLSSYSSNLRLLFILASVFLLLILQIFFLFLKASIFQFFVCFKFSYFSDIIFPNSCLHIQIYSNFSFSSKTKKNCDLFAFEFG